MYKVHASSPLDTGLGVTPHVSGHRQKLGRETDRISLFMGFDPVGPKVSTLNFDWIFEVELVSIELYNFRLSFYHPNENC